MWATLLATPLLWLWISTGQTIGATFKLHHYLAVSKDGRIVALEQAIHQRRHAALKQFARWLAARTKHVVIREHVRTAADLRG